MGAISIDYSCLHSAVSHTKSLSDALTTYHDQISSTVQTKLSGLTGGSDTKGYISSAESLASKKMQTMSAKAAKASAFKQQLDDFVTLAEDADKNVASEISTQGAAMTGKRTTWQKVGDWVYNTFCVDLVNAVPVIDAIANAVKWVADKTGNVIDSVCRWFKYKGGKYVGNIVLTVVGIFAAIAAAIVAVVTAGTALAIAAAVAAVILAVIAVVNGVISIYNNAKAKRQFDEGKIGRSRYYGSIEGLSDAVSKYDMGDEKANKRWKIGGIVMDTVEVACQVVVAINGIANIGGVKNPDSGKVGSYSWDEAKKNIKESFGIKRRRYSIDPKTGKAIDYNGQKKGYKVGDKWKFKDMLTSRKDGTDKQYFRKYLGFGKTDDVFYNKDVISSMSKNPKNTTQKVAKLFSQLTPGQKITKTILDTSGIIGTVKGRLDSYDKMVDGIETMFDGGKSTKDRIDGGFSALNGAWSNMDFFKVVDDSSKITGFVNSGAK